MPLYLLDTNAVSDLVANHPRVRAKVGAVAAPDRAAISTISLGEVLFGLAKMPQGARRQRIEARTAAAFATLVAEPVPTSAAQHYASIKAFRRSTGRTLDENDLWIAATAIALGAVLV